MSKASRERGGMAAWAVAAVTALAASGCCFGGTSVAPTPVGTAPVPVVPAVAPASGAPITLATGFAPDPHVATGVAGGTIDAGALNPECAGYVANAQQPTHLLVLGAAFPSLTIVAHADDDSTILVQKPDGTWMCNDDFVGLDAGVSGAFAAGTYRVWVGSYSESAGMPYTLTIGTAAPAGAPTGDLVVDALNEICPDVWCEGDYDYTFQSVACSPAGCVVTFDARSEGRTLHDTITVTGVTSATDASGEMSEVFAERFTDALGEWEARH